MFKIIEATTKDLYFFKEMIYEALYVRAGEVPFVESIIEEPNLKKYYTNWSREGDIGFVLIVDNQKVGLCWSRVFTKENPSYGFIDEKTPELTIALKKDFRNRGLGSKLIHQLIEENKKMGFQQISLSVDQENPAVGLYQRLGFEMYKEEGTAFTMLKVF